MGTPQFEQYWAPFGILFPHLGQYNIIYYINIKDGVFSNILPFYKNIFFMKYLW